MRPHVIVNCAMSADGKIAGRDRRQVRISSDEDIARVKALRASVDAILVGVGTVLADDPHLTLKGMSFEENPLRVVLDSRGRTPDDARVLDGRARTVIFTSEECTCSWDGAEAARCGTGQVDVRAMLERLGGMGVERLMVEGGGEVLWSFFSSGLVDEYNVFVGPLIIGGRDAPTPVDGAGLPGSEARRLRFLGAEVLGEGVLLRYGTEDAQVHRG
jgi:2,5-diamino-6-(ribosylamino)-4(3H)-pyrimidinone 5'-phosphate reductase